METAIPRSLRRFENFPSAHGAVWNCSNSTSGFQRNRGNFNQFRRSPNETAFSFFIVLSLLPMASRGCNGSNPSNPGGSGGPNAHHTGPPRQPLLPAGLQRRSRPDIDGSLGSAANYAILAHTRSRNSGSTTLCGACFGTGSEVDGGIRLMRRGEGFK